MMGENIFRAVFIFCLFSFTKGNIVVDEECLNYTVYPVQYEINIYPHMQVNGFYYDCELIITIIANAPNVREITLDAKDFEIESAGIKVFDGPHNIINTPRPFIFDNRKGKLIIYLREPLKMYSQYNKQFYYIKISFRKFLEEGKQGIFLSKHNDENSETHYSYLFATRLSPYQAKYFFPCFANPRFEAVFKFKVYILKQLNGLPYANTSLVIAEQQRITNDNNYIIIDYKPSPQVCLHQVGFHYSGFVSDRVKSKHTNDTIIIWAPAKELHDYKFIHNYGIMIIDLIHEYAKDNNRPLVQGPINLIPVPGPVSGMYGYEIGSWNLLTDSAHRIVKIDQFTSIQQIENMTFELTQQLCRIWLGNPGEIARTRWKEEWFKEGMATYLAYFFLTQYNYGYQSQERRHLAAYGLRMKHKAMALDWQYTTPALYSFNQSLAIEIPPEYRELVTMKTGAILWMLENWVDSDKFHQALVNYIKSRRGKYISLDSFTTALDQATIDCLHQYFNGSTATRILGSWFRRPGYPVINVQVLRDRQPNAVQLKQRLFNFNRDNRIDTDFLIPISYMVQNNKNCYNCYQPRFTIGAQSYTFSENLNDGWILLNRKGSGYYRVNYDAVTWRLIAKTLKEDMNAIDELNRAQIVNDVFALYVAGDLDVQFAMEILDYLDKERSHIVWESALSGYEMLTTYGAACNMTKYLYKEWEDFMIKKVSPIFTQMTNTQDNKYLPRLFRSNVIQLTCELNYRPCNRHVSTVYREYRNGKNTYFPDCRMSYFYISPNNSTWPLNPIEQEDKWIADEKRGAKNWFYSHISVGEPRPMPIVMSTTEKPVAAVTEKLHADGASSIEYSIMILGIAVFVNVFTRELIEI
ncbi:hypothetical protein PYW07_001858 [Mythimna separata]|uniref:Aminopeptidase N n=1 Tax=Mythimna separata TaxID=271217 RepID=A0AAD7YV56_MYTSE|nr:hypothetical protein PYW07_001858 [Mythimna separata]